MHHSSQQLSDKTLDLKHRIGLLDDEIDQLQQDLKSKLQKRLME
jgi:uncharacterized small protein (DUF1192 family)